MTARRARCRHRGWRTGTCGSRCPPARPAPGERCTGRPAVGHDPGDRLLVGGPVFGAWRPGVGGVHDAFLTTCRRTRPGSGVGVASSRVRVSCRRWRGVGGRRGGRGGGRCSRGGRGRARVGGCRARAGRRRVASGVACGRGRARCGWWRAGWRPGRVLPVGTGSGFRLRRRRGLGRHSAATRESDRPAVGHEQQPGQQDLGLGQPEVDAAFHTATGGGFDQGAGGALGAHDADGPADRRPARRLHLRGGAGEGAEGAGGVIDPDLAGAGPPAQGGAQQVGFDAGEDRGAFPFEDAADRRGGLAGPGRPHQRHRPPGPPDAADATDAGCGLGGHQPATETGHDEPPRGRLAGQDRCEVATPRPAGPGVDPQGPSPHGPHRAAGHHSGRTAPRWQRPCGARWTAAPTTPGRAREPARSSASATNLRVTVAASTGRGTPTGPTYAARARLLVGDEGRRAYQLLRARYRSARIVYGVIGLLMRLLRRGHGYVGIAVEPSPTVDLPSDR